MILKYVRRYLDLTIINAGYNSLVNIKNVLLSYKSYKKLYDIFIYYLNAS